MSSEASASGAARPRPYVGPRAFQPNEHLYGRERETGKLLNLLLAERIVLFYSPSGAGKTSLIQAALIPKLQQRRFHVPAVLRVNLEPPQALAGNPKFNRYVFSVISGLEDARPASEQLGLTELAELPLAAYFERRPKPGPGSVVEALVFDQFEEVLTLDPTDQALKLEFFTQLGQLLEERTRWALFSMREDFIAALDPYLLPIPTRFSNTLRLDLLDEQAARQAIQQPSRQAGVDFTDEAAIQLVDDLRQVQVQRSDGSMSSQPGPYVEPVQLQVVCYRLWEGLPPGQKQIVAADLGSIGDVDRSLSDYYADSVRDIAAETGVRQRTIRAWVETQLISAQGARLQLLMETSRSGGLDNQAIRRLQDAHLIRAEQRRGATWFELSHDRLIKPVRENNAAWFAANLNVVQRQAALWDSEHRSEGLLLSGESLVEAERWAAEPGRELTPVEQEFMQACGQARRAVERDRQRSRAIAVLGVMAVLAAIVAIVFGIVAGNSVRQANISLTAAQVARTTEQSSNAAAVVQKDQADQAKAVAQTQAAVAVNAQATGASVQVTADAQRATADAAQASAEEQRQAALAVYSHFLAAEARHALAEGNIDLTLLLGVEAYQAQQSDEATQILRDAISRFTPGSVEALKGQAIPLQNDVIFSVSFSPDGSKLAWGTNDGTVAVWDLATHVMRTLGKLPGQAYGVAFSPDGNTMAAAGEAGTVTLFPAASNEAAALLTEPNGNAIESVAWSPDGSLLAAGHIGGAITIWDMTTREVAQRLTVGHFDNVASLAWSASGDRLASAALDGRIVVYDTTTWQPAMIMKTDREGGVWSVAWSPDEVWLASGDRYGVIIVWDAATGQQIARPEVPNPDGGQQVQFTPQAPGEPNTSGVPIYSLAVSSDGHLLAAASANRSITYWDMTVPSVPNLLTQRVDHADSVRTLAFSPAGPILASGGVDQQIFLWRVVPPIDPNVELAELACGLASRNMTDAEWTQYFPGVEYRATCPGK